MTFEERFPSLKGKTLEVARFDCKDVKWVNNFDIQEHCLDKAKVKDAVEFWTRNLRSNKSQEFIRKNILNELKLEEKWGNHQWLIYCE